MVQEMADKTGRCGGACACETDSAVQPSLLESLLAEQQTLRTPVALFAEQHDSRSVRERFMHLIPLSKATSWGTVCV